ncbi:hypothetical protein [Spirosoma gilvum]
MKKNLSLGLCLLWLFVGICCRPSEQPIEPIELEQEVPQTVQQSLRRAYPDASQIEFTTLSKDQLWKARFVVKHEQKLAVIEKGGKLLQDMSLSPTGIAQEDIIAWAKANHNDLLIGHIYQENTPGRPANYRVDLADIDTTRSHMKIVAYFDGSGQFIEQKPYQVESVKRISRSDLPLTIQQYLAERPDLVEISIGPVKSSIEEKSNSGQKTYELTLTGRGGHYLLIFSQEGTLQHAYTFLHPDFQSVAISQVLPLTATSLTQQFPNWKFIKGDQQTVYSYTVCYLLYIEVNQVKYSVITTPKGEIIQIQRV